ncbi:hypothetical protein V8G54_011396 [Vigna mungo]|uniref:Uncharacterized protein n=1 Tax=Vigna mungo TaxID=3915 RepID=A0AAQ3NP15_VIGMU
MHLWFNFVGKFGHSKGKMVGWSRKLVVCAGKERERRRNQIPNKEEQGVNEEERDFVLGSNEEVCSSSPYPRRPLCTHAALFALPLSILADHFAHRHLSRHFRASLPILLSSSFLEHTQVDTQPLKGFRRSSCCFLRTGHHATTLDKESCQNRFPYPLPLSPIELSHNPLKKPYPGRPPKALIFSPATSRDAGATINSGSRPFLHSSRERDRSLLRGSSPGRAHPLYQPGSHLCYQSPPRWLLTTTPPPFTFACEQGSPSPLLFYFYLLILTGVVVAKEKEVAATESISHSYCESPTRKILSSSSHSWSPPPKGLRFRLTLRMMAPPTVLPPTTSSSTADDGDENETASDSCLCFPIVSSGCRGVTSSSSQGEIHHIGEEELCLPLPVTPTPTSPLIMDSPPNQNPSPEVSTDLPGIDLVNTSHSSQNETPSLP